MSRALVSNISNNSSNDLGLSTVPRILAQFPLCISIEIACLKNDVDLLSIVLSDINFPTSLMNLYPFGPHTPMAQCCILPPQLHIFVKNH